MHNLMSVEDVLAASTTEHTARSVIWNASSADDLWKALTVHSLSENALALAMQALTVHASPEIYCNALHLRKLVRKTLSSVRGSTADPKLCGKVFEVAVCPCRSDLRNLGFDAQAAIIEAAGPSLERSIAALSQPQEKGSVTLVPGGYLAKHAAIS